MSFADPDGFAVHLSKREAERVIYLIAIFLGVLAHSFFRCIADGFYTVGSDQRVVVTSSGKARRWKRTPRQRIAGQVLNDISSDDPKVLDAVLEVMEVDRLLESGASLDILPSPSNVLLLLGEKENGQIGSSDSPIGPRIGC